MMTVQQAFDLALAHHQGGRLAEAAALYEQILRVAPDHADAWNLLGLTAHVRGRAPAALEWIQRAATLRPTSAMYQQNLGLVLSSQGRIPEAIAAYRRALGLRPDYALAADNLGCALARDGQFSEAVAAHRRALERQPDLAWAHCHLGMALTFLGEFDAALSSLHRAVELAPDSASIYSDFLGLLQYQSTMTPARLLEAHREYDRRHAAPLRASWTPHSNTPQAERPLRIGFVSPHFARHPVAHFLVRLLENLDRQEFTVCCYSDTAPTDAWTARLQAASATWREVAGLSDEELARVIRADQIDVLFDLAGHTPGNRLLAFARKPAPIQITWLDYVGTTGVTAMDYILANAGEIPAEEECHYSEKVLRMPDDYICYDPPATAPAVAPLPALAAGHVTFGSFNILAKTTPQMMEVWARILQRVPNARLLLKNVGWSEAATRERVRAFFAAQGIGAERLELQGWSPPDELLAGYHRVDIALDTFPYNGGLTTCEALWMGVPVVTRPGERFASRHGISHLSAVGLTETIAEDIERYVEVAVALAGNLDRLSALRAGLRERAAQSPLCDGPRFARHLATRIRDAWRRWCMENSVA